jgi:hypothetical protein
LNSGRELPINNSVNNNINNDNDNNVDIKSQGQSIPINTIPINSVSDRGLIDTNNDTNINMDIKDNNSNRNNNKKHHNTVNNNNNTNEQPVMEDSHYPSKKRTLKDRNDDDNNRSDNDSSNVNKSNKSSRSRSNSRPRSSSNNNKNYTKQYEVQQILNHTINQTTGKLEYLVRWKGYSSKDNTWEPAENLTHCKGLINDYESKLINIKKLKLDDPRAGVNSTNINNNSNGEMNIKQFEINNNGRHNEVNMNNDGVINTDKFIVHNQTTNIKLDETKCRSPEEHFQYKNKKLVSVYGDGNCLYRAFSLLHGGDEQHYADCRLSAKNKIISYKSLKDTEYPPRFRANLPYNKNNWSKAIDMAIEATAQNKTHAGIVQAEALALYYNMNMIYNICDYNLTDNGTTVIMSNYAIGPDPSSQPIDVELLLHSNHFYLVVPVEKFDHYYNATIKEKHRMQLNYKNSNNGSDDKNNNNNHDNNDNGNNNNRSFTGPKDGIDSNGSLTKNVTTAGSNIQLNKNNIDANADNISISSSGSIAATIIRETDWKTVQPKSKRNKPATNAITNKQPINPNLHRSQQSALIQSFISEQQSLSTDQSLDGFTIHISKYPVKSGRNIFNDIVNKYDRRLNQSEIYRLTRPLLVHILFGHLPGTRENQMLIELFDKYYPKPSYKIGITIKIINANLTNGQCDINVRYNDNCVIDYQEAIQYMLQQYNNKLSKTSTELTIIPHENKHVDLITCKLWPTPTYFKSDEELQLAFREQGYNGKMEFAREGQHLLGVNAVCSRADFALLLDLSLNPTGKILQKFSVSMIKSKRGPCYRCSSVHHMQYDCPYVEKPSLLCKHCGVVDKHKTTECKSKYKQQCRWCEKLGRKSFNTHNLSNCRELKSRETPVDMDGMYKQIMKIKESYTKETESNNSSSMTDATNKINQWKDTTRIAIMLHKPAVSNNKSKRATDKTESTTGKANEEWPNLPNQAGKPQPQTQAQLKFVPITINGNNNTNEVSERMNIMQETVRALAETVKQSMIQQQLYQQQSQQQFQQFQDLMQRVIQSNYNNNGVQPKAPPPSFELSQDSNISKSNNIAVRMQDEPSPPPSQNTLQERKTKQQQFTLNPNFNSIVDSSKQRELTGLLNNRLDRQADCLHNQLKYLEKLYDLNDNNNYDRRSETATKHIVEQKNCPSLPGKKGIYAKKHIKHGTKICNYMGYVLPQNRPTQGLPCSTVIATECNSKVEECFLVGIPNTIGPMINHASAQNANCVFRINNDKFKSDSTIIPSDWITIQTVEDIEEDEELTVNYGNDYWLGHEESCSICFGKDSSNENPILYCDGVVNDAACKTQIHLHCALLNKKPIGEYYCPCCINIMQESASKSSNKIINE